MSCNTHKCDRCSSPVGSFSESVDPREIVILSEDENFHVRMEDEVEYFGRRFSSFINFPDCLKRCRESIMSSMSRACGYATKLKNASKSVEPGLSEYVEEYRLLLEKVDDRIAELAIGRTTPDLSSGGAEKVSWS